MEGYGKKYHLAVGWSPVDKDGGGTSDIICLKGYAMAEVWILVGGTMTKTAAVTMSQGLNVTTCATSLPFDRYFDSGCHLLYDGASTQIPAAAGETAIGAATASGYVYSDNGSEIVLYGRDETAYVDNEVLTFSGGKTAVVNGTLFNEDIMIPRTATSDTFSITQVHDASRRFMIPISASMLTSPNDCISLTIGDPDTCLMTCFYILSNCRTAKIPMPTAIYN